MTVLVSGATSQIGRFLLPRLVQAGRQVQAVSRQPQPAQDGVQWLCGDLAGALDSVPSPHWRAIASFGPLEGLAAWLGRQATAPARQVIATSSMSVLSKQDSAQADEQDVVAMLQRGEAGLIAQAERLGMAWTILRPTLIYGAGIDRSITPIVQRALRLRVFPIPLADGLRQPVHADDIARAVLACITTGAGAARVLEIGGGERLPYHAMFRRVHASLSQTTLALPLPGGTLRGLAALLPRARGPVSRLQQDLTADNGPLQALLGVQPRPFRPEAQTWQPMSAAQALQRIAAVPVNQ
ncbi:SDR family oxidoreductase [Stenotrophomonas maltophilia]